MSFYTGKNVLVAGAAGLIGHSLVKKLLEQGAHVRGTQFTARKVMVEHKNLEIVQCDLMKMEDCDRVVKDMDIVFNSAAAVRGAGGQVKDATCLVRNNIFPMINLIDASARAENERFVLIGSSTVYPAFTHPCKEEEGFLDEPYKTYQGIGWVKRYSEKLCAHYHDITKTKFAISRTTAVYGPYDNFLPDRSHVIPDLIMKAERRESPFTVWGDGTQVRDFIYVDDFTDALMALAEKHAVADPVNIASGVPTTVSELVKVITSVSGYTPELVYDTSKPTAIPYRMLDITKAKTLLNWSPALTLEEGIRKTIDWYRTDYRA